MLKCGADKVSVNSGAIRRPELIDEAARRYGNQCVVLSMDVKRVNGSFHIFRTAAASTRGWTPLSGRRTACAAGPESWLSTASTPTA